MFGLREKIDLVKYQFKKLITRKFKEQILAKFHINPFPPSVPIWHRLVKL